MRSLFLTLLDKLRNLAPISKGPKWLAVGDVGSGGMADLAESFVSLLMCFVCACWTSWLKTHRF